MKITDITEMSHGEITAKTPIRRAKQIWSQIDDLFVDLMDEMLEAHKNDPSNLNVKTALKALQEDDLKKFHRILRTAMDSNKRKREEMYPKSERERMFPRTRT